MAWTAQEVLHQLAPSSCPCSIWPALCCAGSKSPLSPLSLETSPEYSPTDRTPEPGSPADSLRADRVSFAAGGHQGQQQGTQGSAADPVAQQGAEEGAKLGSSTAGAQPPPVERPGAVASEGSSSTHQPVVPVELSATAVKKVFGQGEPLGQPLLAKTESGR